MNSFISNVNLLVQNLPTLLQFTTEDRIRNFVFVRVDNYFNDQNIGDTVLQGLQEAIRNIDLDANPSTDTTLLDVFVYSISDKIDNTPTLFPISLEAYLNKDNNALNLIQAVANDTNSNIYALFSTKTDEFFDSETATIRVMVNDRINSQDFLNILTQIATDKIEGIAPGIVSSNVTAILENEASTQVGNLVVPTLTTIGQTAVDAIVDNIVETEANTQVTNIIDEKINVVLDDINVQIKVGEHIEQRLTNIGFDTLVNTKVSNEYVTTLQQVIDNINNTTAFQAAIINAKDEINTLADTRIDQINTVINSAKSLYDYLNDPNIRFDLASQQAEIALATALSTQTYNEALLNAIMLQMLSLEIQDTANQLNTIKAQAEAARDAAIAAANLSNDMLDSVKKSISTASFAFLSQDFYKGQSI